MYGVRIGFFGRLKLKAILLCEKVGEKRRRRILKKRLKKKLKMCQVCNKKVDAKGLYGQSGNWYWCEECIDTDS